MDHFLDSIRKTNSSDRRNIVQLIPAVRMAIRANFALLLEGPRFNRKFSDSDIRTGSNEFRIRLDLVF